MTTEFKAFIDSENSDDVLDDILIDNFDKHQNLKKMGDDEWEPAQYIIDRLRAAQTLHMVNNTVKSIKLYDESLLQDAQNLQATARLLLEKEEKE